MKEQKGITLIALIITIVVLLILAAVAISSITNDGIISQAQNAVSKYNEAQSNEQVIFQNYIEYLNTNGTDNGEGNNETEETPEYAKVTLKSGTSLSFAYVYVGEDELIYADDVDSIELNVKVGEKLEFPIWYGPTTYGLPLETPCAKEDIQWKEQTVGDLTVEDVPCYVWTGQQPFLLCVTDSGETIDIENYYISEDITINCSADD